MASEPADAERDLVSLYADRLRSRGRIAACPALYRPAPTVHQFGRRAPARTRRSALARGGTVGTLVATALLFGTQAASAATTHQVQPGETLASIADQYQTTVAHLALLNNLSDPNYIVAGSTLTIVPDAPAPPEAVRKHQVKPGETLFGIAGHYGVTLGSLVQANNITDPNLILVGQELNIPNMSPASTQPAAASPQAGSVPLHLVRPGETLGEIADQYGVSVEALATANNVADPNKLESGTLLRIPGAAPVARDGAVKLTGMPALRQSLPLSCESAAASIATAYWGNQISEWVFIENLPQHPNPHHGFRGSMTGAFGGTDDYGVYSEPFVALLARYGFVGEAFYADGNADLLKQQLDAGHPVVVWVTNMTSVQTRSYAWTDGERYALVPQEHAVVVYGYDQDKVYVVDPGDGAYRTFGWDDFMRSWGYFDGMSLAVYPA